MTKDEFIAELERAKYFNPETYPKQRADYIFRDIDEKDFNKLGFIKYSKRHVTKYCKGNLILMYNYRKHILSAYNKVNDKVNLNNFIFQNKYVKNVIELRHILEFYNLK